MTPTEYLQECRKRAGKSARALSQLLDREDSYISVMERRGAVPPADVIVRLEELLPEFSGSYISELALEEARRHRGPRKSRHSRKFRTASQPKPDAASPAA